MSNTCLECGGTGKSAAMPGFSCSTCKRSEFFRERAAFNSVRVTDVPAPRERKTGPYSTADLIGLRALAETHDPAGMTRRLLATVDQMQAERDQALASLKVSDEGRTAAIRMMDAWKDKADKNDEALTELRETARVLLTDINGAEGPLTCDLCDRMALMIDSKTRFCCEAHANDGKDLSYAPALRRLCALVEVKP